MAVDQGTKIPIWLDCDPGEFSLPVKQTGKLCANTQPGHDVSLPLFLSILFTSLPYLLFLYRKLVTNFLHHVTLFQPLSSSPSTLLTIKNQDAFAILLSAHHPSLQ